MKELIENKKKLIKYDSTKKIYDVVDSKYLYKSDLDVYFVGKDLTDKIKYVLSVDKKDINLIVEKKYKNYERDINFFIKEFSNLIEKLVTL